MFRNNAISNLSDEELLIAHKESGKKIFIEELFIRYLPLFYGVCLKYLKDFQKAREAVDQLFEDLLYVIADYDIDEFRPWIYGVVKNYCLQMLQKEKHFVAVDFTGSSSEFDNILQLLENSHDEQPSLLVECMNKLPERQRVSLTYFFTDELSYAEIVTKTGYTLRNVKNYIHSGMRDLKICMENNAQ